MWEQQLWGILLHILGSLSSGALGRSLKMWLRRAVGAPLDQIRLLVHHRERLPYNSHLRLRAHHHRMRFPAQLLELSLPSPLAIHLVPLARHLVRLQIGRSMDLLGFLRIS